MVARLARLALERPWALLGANAALALAAIALAAGAPERLGVGSLRLDDAATRADFAIATRARTPVDSRVYQVALDVISTRVGGDPEVEEVRRGPVSKGGRSTALLVDLETGDEGERQRAAERIFAAIDPGPLRIELRGELARLVETRHSLSGELWELELLVLPLALLVLWAALGPRMAPAAILAAVTAVAGCLAGLRLAGLVADVSLLGIAPGALLGLALGIELPCLMAACFRDERALAETPVAIERTIAAGFRFGLLGTAGAAAVAAGLLATPLDQAPSLVLGCALAALLASASALVAVPALLALRERAGAAPALAERSAPMLALRGLAVRLSGSRASALAAGVVALAALAALAAPALDGRSRPFAAADGGSLFADLPAAAAVAAIALAALVVIAFRSARALPAAIAALAAAAAAAGLCVLVFQDGHLARVLGQERQGAVETGALAALVASVAALSAARGLAAAATARGQRALGMPPASAAQRIAGLTAPAALAGTIVAGAGAAVLGAADVEPARQFGLAVAAGLLLDLALLRPATVAALARWGG